MATFDLANTVKSVEYEEGHSPSDGLVVTKVTDGESDMVFNVGDTVTYTWIDAFDEEQTSTAEFIGTMSVTVSGKTQVFMVLEETILGTKVQVVVGLNPDDAPSTIIRTGASANFKAETFTVCFFPGTLIATPFGARKVEELVSGDLVVIGEYGAVPTTWIARMGEKFRKRLGIARAVPVKWTGRQTVSTRFGPAERLMPVRFAAGSLGGGGKPFCRIES